MSSTETQVEFTITEAAVGQVREIMSQQQVGADERNLRVFVEGGGCCGGVGFGLAFDAAQDGDVRLERSGLSVVIDPMSLPFVNGVTIDFVNTPEVQGFKVSAPPMPKGAQGGGCCGSSAEASSGGGCGSGGGGGGGGCGCGTGQGTGACGSGAASGHGHGGHAHGAKSHGGGGCCG
jgi:iron-sulfur cluster assembly accessory protein